MARKRGKKRKESTPPIVWNVNTRVGKMRMIYVNSKKSAAEDNPRCRPIWKIRDNWLKTGATRGKIPAGALTSQK